MTTPQPNWTRPPVIEVVVGVQFAQIAGLNNGTLGLFWHAMREHYPLADDAPPVPLVLEAVGAEPEFGLPGISFGPARGDSRLRLISADQTRMIQVQNGWLLANWMKRAGSPYPGFSGVLTQFNSALQGFEQFLANEKLSPMTPEVWEVTYIDHMPRGTVWKDFGDIPAVLPGLLGAGVGLPSQLQTIQATWEFGLLANPGRLEIVVQTARTMGDPFTDILATRSTARGPITPASTLESALNHGRTAAVETFMSVTSDAARAYWKG